MREMSRKLRLLVENEEENTTEVALYLQSQDNGDVVLRARQGGDAWYLLTITRDGELELTGSIPSTLLMDTDDSGRLVPYTNTKTGATWE